MDTEIEEVKQDVRKVEQDVWKVEQDIRKVEEDIKKVEERIDDAERQLTTAATVPDVDYWRSEKADLREDKEQLRKKEEQLRKKEEQLRKKEEQLQKKEEQLREEKLVLLKAGTSGRPQKRVKLEAIPGDVADFNMLEWEAGSFKKMDSIVKVMEKFGGFPAEYYICIEEVMVFRCFEKVRMEVQIKDGSQWDLKMAIIGSPGVGKSTLLIFLAFFLAKYRSEKVLLVRKLKGATATYVYVLLTRDGYLGSKLESFDEVTRLRNEESEKGKLWFFLDGCSGEEVSHHHMQLGAFNLLATSTQFIPKQDDPTRLVVVPAWDLDDLKAFSKKSSILQESEVEAAYNSSGGSVREFTMGAGSLPEEGSHLYWAKCANYVLLWLKFGCSTKGQCDFSQRLYVRDRKQRAHYMSSEYWDLIVDSRKLLRSLVSQSSVDEFTRLVDITKSIGGSVYEGAFEHLLHKLADTPNGFILEAKSLSSGPLLNISIPGGFATYHGANEVECLDYVEKQWLSNPGLKYWYPDFPTFPMIDCIAKTEKYLVYMQITVGSTHKKNGEWLDKLDKICESYFQNRICGGAPKALIKAFNLTGDDTRVPTFLANII